MPTDQNPAMHSEKPNSTPPGSPVTRPEIRNEATAAAVIPSESSVDRFEPADIAATLPNAAAPVAGVAAVTMPPASPSTASAGTDTRGRSPASSQISQAATEMTSVRLMTSPRPDSPGGCELVATIVPTTIARPTRRAAVVAPGTPGATQPGVIDVAQRASADCGTLSPYPGSSRDAPARGLNPALHPGD